MELHFVLCPSFHGATLLALLLNNHSKVSALGDTVPSRAFDQACACTKKVSECPFWQTVRSEIGTDRFAHSGVWLPNLPFALHSKNFALLSRMAEAGIDGRVRLFPSPTANQLVDRTIGNLAAGLLPIVWQRFPRHTKTFVQAHLAFYELVRRLHQTNLVVDGTKSTAKVFALRALVPGISAIKVIHLVRDPRGFVASWQKNVGNARTNVIASMWADMHRRIQLLTKKVGIDSLAVKYETLCSQPDVQMNAVFRFLGVEPQAVCAPPRDKRKHHLMGNKMVFSFDGGVKLDERWRKRLSGEEQSIALRAAGEFAERQGYA
jgi:hypothetical protein